MTWSHTFSRARPRFPAFASDAKVITLVLVLHNTQLKIALRVKLVFESTRYVFSGKLIQTNSGAREHLFYEAPAGNRKTISVSDVERLQWSTFTCVLGPTVKGVFPPGSDVTDVNATCRTKDCSLLASGDDFGFVKLFEYPVSVSIFCKKFL